MFLNLVQLRHAVDAVNFLGGADDAVQHFARVIFADGRFGADGLRTVMIEAANQFVGERFAGV